MTISWLTAFLDFPAASFGAGVSFWQEVTGYGLSPARGSNDEFATLVHGQGDEFLRVQRLTDGPAGCHLDLRSAAVQPLADQLTDLGARVQWQRPGLVVLSSPGGVTFCVLEHQGEAARPAPAHWPGGHQSVVDQLCLDIPAGSYEAECGFWAAATGWELRHSSRPEYAYLTRPAGMPLRLLLQRLGERDDSGGRAHLDLSCDDVAAECQRHTALGATVVRTMPVWTTLRDPAGLEYCVTSRDPGTGALPGP